MMFTWADALAGDATDQEAATIPRIVANPACSRRP
jgi:hypothetical protein